MTAYLIRFHLLLELFIYWLILWRTMAEPIQVGEMLLWMLIMALGLRLLLVMLSYGYAIRWRSEPPPELRVGWLEKVGAFFYEWAVLVVLTMLIMPIDAWWMGERERLRRPTNGKPPILLVHGFLANRAYWWWAKKKLEEAGWTVATLTLRPVFTNIDNYAPQVAARIRTVLSETGTSQVILVTHSMGGLVARAYFRLYGIDKVARFFSLGSPQHGTRFATLALGLNGSQMRIGSEWLRALNGPGAVPLPPTTVMFSYGDNVVMPQETARIDGVADADTIAVASVGHVAMAFSPAFVRALIDAL